MLTIHSNNNHERDRTYIYEVVFQDFWKIDYQIVFEKRQDVLLEMDGKTISLSDDFFQQDEKLWLTMESLPHQPLAHIQIQPPYIAAVADIDLPVIYGSFPDNKLFDGNRCFLDVFGSAFYMLTRYEEIVKQDRDALDRFPASASLAFQEGFLERPIINEYLELLWWWMKGTWPHLIRQEKSFSIMPTHDVDAPFLSMQLHGYRKYRSLLGDVLKRHSFSLMRRKLQLYHDLARNDSSNDPYNTFETIMDISEQHNLTSNFYFMTAQRRDEKDGNYDILSTPICALAQRMLERGHHIGIHPGFGSYKSQERIQADTDRLRAMISREKLEIKDFGGRQHYLHWKAPDTWQYYEKAGILYDTTLSYADHIGFRCGVCYDYPVYNVVTQERYALREYPLEVMECSGIDERYMNLSHTEMHLRCIAMKKMVQKYQGVFVILWHNTRFINLLEKGLYVSILEG